MEGRQSQAAAGLIGDFWIASSRYGYGCDGEVERREGGDVMVKPPAFGMPGTWTSSHWPGKNYED